MIALISEKFISLILAITLCYTAFSQNVNGVDQIGRDNLNTITTAVPFLLISPDSRAGGMGDVGVATSPDANSLHWNPAKFAFVEDEVGFAVSYVPWLRALVPDINLSYLAGYKKLNKNEAIAMKEWLQHYINQGVEHFYMIDNGSTDNWESEVDGFPVTIFYDDEKHKQNDHYNKYFF